MRRSQPCRGTRCSAHPCHGDLRHEKPLADGQKALEGAEFVVCTVRIGGYEPLEAEWERTISSPFSSTLPGTWNGSARIEKHGAPMDDRAGFSWHVDANRLYGLFPVGNPARCAPLDGATAAQSHEQRDPATDTEDGERPRCVPSRRSDDTRTRSFDQAKKLIDTL
jgi:hypothetical protein